jgi:uncharacterized protein YcfL
MKKMIMAGIFLVLAVVAISGCVSNGNNTNTSSQPVINVTNITVSSEGDGFYDLKAAITPTKDMDYLEMDAIWYDSSGAVVQTSQLLWNVDNAKAGQVYKATGSDTTSGTPAKVDVYFFDSVFSGGDTSNAIYNKTIVLNKK